ncbi:DNA polymerase III subunit chi [Gilvimarinus algae]|uniref:DNA polymerase III subunit chi n=1 Tax=Gilvimarinus algae TaxID=3058037 RepID=A0ABT8TFI5_9GAMM|nr:DNA polymerase III subunit chi [Gilvimarinus sp. SDUM040014]MDO3382686.1 DNA polymerase III subunit chi [Gilvimarinus sp. SDUM040014]
MTRVDFYILPTAEPEHRLGFISRLVAKALRQRRQILIACDSDESAAGLEHALLHEQPESYIPFRRANEPDHQEPVIIAVEQDCGEQHDLLISLGPQLPDYFSRFQRLIEVVVQEPQILEQTRKHWAFFKERGYPVHHHKL